MQTENKQPFYVKIEKKVFSSSASGYLIIPKLLDGTYTLTLGFPKNEWPEQHVTCTLNKKDAGYIVKNFGDKGWGLFNWQTMDVVMGTGKQVTADVAKTAASNPVEETKTVIKPEEKLIITPEVKIEEPVKAVAVITKLFSAADSGGMQMVYVDNANGKSDTIRLLIPAEEGFPESPQQQKAADPVQKNTIPEMDSNVTKTDTPVMIKPVEKTEIIVKQQPVVIDDSKTENAVTPEKQEAPTVKPLLPNSDCKAFAVEDDFLKLRKKMAAENSDDDMVVAAKKTFKSKCFTTQQVKNLSALFLTDEGKYKFFDAAYPFISDSYNFSSLQTQLTDDYFINRFKAMLRH